MLATNIRPHVICSSATDQNIQRRLESVGIATVAYTRPTAWNTVTVGPTQSVSKFD